MSLTKIREDFPITTSTTYLNTANHCPPSTPVQRAIRDFLCDWDNLARHGDRRVEEACGSFAKLIGAHPDEVACQPNTSRGLAAVAGALSLKPGRNVVVNDLENPANIYPWTMTRGMGVDVRKVKGRGGAVRISDLESAVDDTTRVIAISHVEWLTGARHPLRPIADLAHDHGAYLVVDGIQAAGALKVDVKRDDVDFYACGSYKWLLGPSGAGFLYVKDEHWRDLKPAQVGYRGVAEHSMDEPRLKETAKKIEFGEPSYLSFVGTDAGIQTILRYGPDNIERRVTRLAQRLYDGLVEQGVELVSPSEKELRSGIVSFRTRDTQKTYDALTGAGFVVSLRTAGIRVSANFYNSEEEIDRLLEGVKEGVG